jgi:hypothetical protein
MSQEEFENYCNGLIDESTSSNVLKQIQTNLKILSELKDKQKLLKQETLNLQTDMISFTNSMEQKFHQCLNQVREKYTKNINGYTRKNVLDDNQDVLLFNQTKLLLPLKPLNTAPDNSNNPKTDDILNTSQSSEKIL